MLAAVLVVAGIVLTRSDPCEAWLSDFDRWRYTDNPGVDVDDPTINPEELAVMRRLAKLADDRPAGCEAPGEWQAVLDQVEGRDI